jgi:hypothetical protein
MNIGASGAGMETGPYQFDLSTNGCETGKHLTHFQKEITALRFTSNKLSSTERIERIARKSLDLEYPATSQVYVINIPSDQKGNSVIKDAGYRCIFRK